MSATSQLQQQLNFPVNLDIHPSSHPCLFDLEILEGTFGFDGQELAIWEYGIAGRVWEAAYTMISYIRTADTLEFDPPFFDAIRCLPQYFIIELGSGSGLVASIVAGMLRPGKDLLIATDLPEVCSLLEQNLKQLPVVVRPLSWGNHSEAIRLCSDFIGKESSCGNLTHIICSDLIYFPDLFAPLLRTLLDLTSTSASQLSDTPIKPLIFISYKVRSLTKESSFWAAFGLWFDFRPVVVREKLERQWRCFGLDSGDTTFLFVAHRRPESHLWTVPLLEEDLLSGVGANGSNFPKSDDTFESLLMMMSLEHE